MRTPKDRREYQRIKKAEYRAKNPEKHRAYARKWCASRVEKVRENNRQSYRKFCEQRKQKVRDYRKANAEVLRVRARKRYADKKNDPVFIEQRRRCRAKARLSEKRKEYMTKYYAREDVKAANKARNAKRKAILRGASPDADTINVCAMKKCATVCPYCGNMLMSMQDKHLDHIQPICSGGEHKLYNVIVCCKSCNLRKHGRMPVEFAVRV